MEIDDDGEGAGVARAERRADEPRDKPPPPRPREVRPSSIRPGAETVRLHNMTYHSWCEVCVASKDKSDRYHREASQPMDGDNRGSRWISCSWMQKEHSWMNRERERQFSW